MALTVTEDWIRERVQLKHNNLEDVRSLSLPGTYHEKIHHLGDALRKFSRLKTLDLSRNAIESLQGLESVQMLEKLNLYYNNIPSLQELYRLRQNQKLLELDLRLNPVARNEPDYRLFLIHMLPNLRRLDDRAIRDSERKAALQHFTTEQANELSDHPKVPSREETKPNTRAEHIKSLAKPPSVLTDDDIAVLDMVNRVDGDLSQPRPVTGSKSSVPSMEDYTAEAVRQMNRDGVGLDNYPPAQAASIPSHHQYLSGENIKAGANTHPSTSDVDSFQAKYPNLPPLPHNSSSKREDTKDKDSYMHHSLPLPSETGRGSEPTRRNRSALTQSRSNGAKYRNDGRRVQFADDPNLKYQDEADAYLSYSSKGHFTPNPDPPKGQSHISEPPPERATLEGYQFQPEVPPNRGAELYSDSEQRKFQAERLPEPEPRLHQSLPIPAPGPNDSLTSYSDDQIQGTVEISGPYDGFIKKTSDLVDKYWNGAKSLPKNPRFKTQIANMIRDIRGDDASSVSTVGNNASLDFEVSRLRDELSRAKTDNINLRDKLFSAAEETASDAGSVHGDDPKLKSSLIRAQRDVGILRSRLQKSIEDNKALQDRICDLESRGPGARGEMGADIGGMHAENDHLKQEIQTLNIRLKQSSQMQELATMLQDSHKSLVQTNEHLLRDLEEARTRHEAEVKQLNWNYSQLKKSAAYGGLPMNGQT